MEETRNLDWMERPVSQQDVDDLIFADEIGYISER